MKRLFLLATFAMAVMMAHAQYFCVSNSAQLHYVNYDEAGQSESNTTYTVRNASNSGDSFTVQYIGKTVTNKVRSTTSYSLIDWTYANAVTTCAEDLMYELYIAENRIADQYDEVARMAMHDLRKYEGDNSFVLPDAVTSGQAMKDRSYKYLKNMFKYDYKISGAVYLGQERVSTTAGRYDCLKVSYLKHTKITLKSSSLRVTEWYAKGIGLVKSVTYDTSGKLKGKTLLVKVTYP